MKVKESNVARILADLDLTPEEVTEITIKPGKVSIAIIEDGIPLVREYGVDQNA